jgi:hypothetical protein
VSYTGSTDAVADVVVQRVPDHNPLPQPIVVSSQILAPGTASLSLPINWAVANDAYFGTVFPATTGPVTVGSDLTTPSPDYFQYGANWGETTGVPDTYNGTANWSYTPGSVATLTFTDTGIALYAVRDVDRGIMDISIDGGSPTAVDDYSPVRIASGVVWTSPTLAEGTHTVTITCTGTHDPSSSGNNIALDSVDIMP